MMGANYGKERAQDYMHRMRNAVGVHLINPDGFYYGREGHLRFARECGCALNDFNEEGKQEILHGSYSAVYVISCHMKPTLDAGEWISEMKTQIGRF